MSNIPNLILDNRQFLEQGLLVLKRIDDGVYAHRDTPFEHGGIGRHIRHVLDHYALFWDGVPEGVIDYDARLRDPGVEQDRLQAMAVFENLIRKLMVWSEAQPNLDDVLRVQHNGRWCRSSVGRELQHLINHTVHHYAFIALILRLLGVAVEKNFGVAPSTFQAQVIR